MSLFMMAVYFAVAGAVTMIGIGIYAITLDRREDHHADSICIPSRRSALTGAYMDQQPSYPPQADEYQQQGDDYLQQWAVGMELQRQAAEIERLQAVIRQRNRLIRRLQSKLEQQLVEQPVTVGKADRFEWLEIRGN